MITSRRGFLGGVTAFLAAPAIVRVASIMPISVQPIAYRWNAMFGVVGYDGTIYRGDSFAELAAITRRAYIPALVTKMYEASPVLDMLMEDDFP